MLSDITTKIRKDILRKIRSLCEAGKCLIYQDSDVFSCLSTSLQAMSYALDSFQTCCDRCENQVIFSCPCREEDYILASADSGKLVTKYYFVDISESNQLYRFFVRCSPVLDGTPKVFFLHRIHCPMPSSRSRLPSL